jgi:predicted phosphodiesterase
MKTEKQITIEYRKDQIKPVQAQQIKDNTYKARIKICAGNSDKETKWLSISLKELNEIKNVLTNGKNFEIFE